MKKNNEKCDDGNCVGCYPEHFEYYDEQTDEIKIRKGTNV